MRNRSHHSYHELFLRLSSTVLSPSVTTCCWSLGQRRRRFYPQNSFQTNVLSSKDENEGTFLSASYITLFLPSEGIFTVGINRCLARCHYIFSVWLYLSHFLSSEVTLYFTVIKLFIIHPSMRSLPPSFRLLTCQRDEVPPFWIYLIEPLEPPRRGLNSSRRKLYVFFSLGWTWSWTVTI